jgi:carboxyl-terminal processing protease
MFKIPPQKIVEIAAAVVIIAAVFGSGFVMGQRAYTLEPTTFFGLLNIEKGEPKNVDFGQFWQVWGFIKAQYVDREKLDSQDMVYGAISGLVNSLGDPHSAFLKPQQAKIFNEDVQGWFGGIGIEIGQRHGALTVIAPLENTPAQRAGLKPGDKIIKINNTETRNLTIDEAVLLIRGPAGTDVVLNVWREEWPKPRDFRITRENIVIPVIEWKMAGEDVAHVRIFSFTGQTDDKFRQVAGEILNSSARALILDLRNNPGGYLDQAVKLAGWFLEPGEIVLMENDGSGTPKDDCDDCRAYKDANARLADFPTVILVNNGSASASEILAGALRDKLGIKLVGEKTFGKGSVQVLESFEDGSSLKITVSKWLTPDGHSIAEQGLAPDAEVKLADDDVKAGRDPQLDRAIELLKNE